MNLPRYPKYKPSGVDWLGEVPEHWEVKRGRFLMSVNPASPIARELPAWTEVSFVPMDAVGEYGGLRLDETKALGETGSGYTEFQDGDVVVAKITPCFENGKGALAQHLVNQAALGTTELHVLRTLRNFDRRYLFFWTISPTFRHCGEAEMYGAGGQKRVPPVFCKNFIFSCPPLPEQQAIADFLERETGRIDALIDRQRKLIDRLKEKRAALITRAVTRGLDPAAKLKDSCVEWLGMVPEGWEVVRIKNVVASLEQGWSPQCESYPVDGPDEWGVLKVGCVNSGSFNPGENKHLPSELEPVPELGIRKGDLLISRANTRDLVGSAAAACADYPNLMLCDKLYRLRLRSGLCTPRFLADYLGIRMVRGQIELDATGASDSMQNIGQSTILELAVPLPPLPEQRAIADYLDRETGKLDRLTERITTVIERLREYRAALITAAVTGKIDVRKAQGAEA